MKDVSLRDTLRAPASARTQGCGGNKVAGIKVCTNVVTETRQLYNRILHQHIGAETRLQGYTGAVVISLQGHKWVEQIVIGTYRCSEFVAQNYW